MHRKSQTAGAAATSAPFALQALDAQAALLPYALILFAVCLPIAIWACSYARDGVWLAASMTIWAINWGAFYAAVDWIKRGSPQAQDADRRTRVHILGGLLWAAAVAQLAFLGDHAGLAREAILMLAVGGAAICVFFSAPLLPAVLIVGPAAAAVPLILLNLDPSSRSMGRFALGAIALVMALSLVLNRLLRSQFSLAAERELLIADRDRSLDRAEILAKSKSDLLATLSSEIRNGLTSAAHVLAAAAGGGRSAPSREQLSAALGATEDLLSVLDATLDMETAGSGRLALEPKPFDLAALVRELVLLHRPQTAAKGLELSLHIEGDLAEAPGAALADAARVRQIAAALLINAIRYTVRGRIELRLGLAAPDRVRLEVVDTGPGLKPEEIEAAFQPFVRIARTASGVPGAGLGLALARQLADLMGATLSAESTVGLGCNFQLDLPYDAVAQVGAASLPLTGGPPGLAQTLRILVAEDDALHAAMLRTLLEQLGHQVLQARDGRRACELAEICEVDLIMLDARLPVMDGPQTARALRQLESLAAGTPIIAIIGGDPEEAAACLAAGADQVLRKPVTVTSVARALTDALSDERPVTRRAVA